MTDDFLQFLEDTRRGRFKVYLGMAAGVGKTVAMLRDGKRLAAEGVDVVCGIVETHGRKETLAEAAGIDMIPRRTIAYRGVPLQEMDLDAILRRAPELCMVDELAHTNVPGSRHEKRWQDVEALLDAGISVIGTLNVQHLESLHDLVLRETEVDVRERVPDRFLHRADEIVVIDVPPEELVERLRQGKIYAPEKIERALRGFFRADNLAALRQLALREVAYVVVLALGVIAEGPGSIFLREGEGPRAFALMAGAMGTEPVALALASLGAGPILAGEATFARLDLARIEALRREVLDAR